MMYLHNDGVGSLQVETETSCTRGKDEDLDWGVLSVEGCDIRCSLFGLGTTIESEVLPVLRLEEIFHDVHDLGHLEEDEDLHSQRVNIPNNLVVHAS